MDNISKLHNIAKAVYIMFQNIAHVNIGIIGHVNEVLWRNIGPRKMAYITSQHQAEHPKICHRTKAKCGWRNL